MKKFFDKPAIVVPLVLVLNTIAIMWPGLLTHIQQNKPLLSGIFWLIAYLLLSELWQIMSRRMYVKRKQFTWIVYGVKLLISLIMIFIIACQSRWSVGVLLLMYELYQSLLYRNSFRYIETIYYPLLTAFFKGFVINIILAIGYPFVLNWGNIQPFVLPMLVFFIVAVFYQIICTHNKPGSFYMLLTLALIATLGFFIYLSIQHPVNIIRLIVFILLVGAVLYGFKQSKRRPMEQELYIALFNLLSILVCY